ncbi:hypothetical protein PINS_up009224 [Pythium insidiosum]|nr:hypothetical protein PINS_up009224 [Pythium insidiosum]
MAAPRREDEWYMEAIQRRVDEMYERAERTIAQRTATSQQADPYLKQAEAAVYELQASLFPLVQQAESTLKEIRAQRQGRLSLVLRPQDLKHIVDHSEYLADRILEDILLDTVHELNKDERRITKHVALEQQASELDELLAKIEAIEVEERALVTSSGKFSLTSSPPTPEDGPSSTLIGGSQQPLQPSIAMMSPSPRSAEREDLAASNIRLPLEAVMQLEIPLSTPNDGHDFADMAHRDNAILSPMPSPRVVWASMSSLSGSPFQRIEKTRRTFLKHRLLVEAALNATGMDQAAVIEILGDMLLNDVVSECAAELEEGVGNLSDALVTSLL